MEDKTDAAIDAAVNHYKCLQREDYYIERDPKDRYLAIKWRNTMDNYANRKTCLRIARFLRKRLPDIPIHSSTELLNV